MRKLIQSIVKTSEFLNEIKITRFFSKEKFVFILSSFTNFMLSIPHLITILDEDKKNVIGSYKIVQFPGCCGILILYNVQVEETFRRKGIGKLIFSEVERIAKECNFSLIVCTYIDECISSKIIDSLNWKKVFHFRNKITNNMVNIAIKQL